MQYRLITALSLFGWATAAPLTTETIHGDAAPVLSSMNSEIVPDSYIVVFKKHVTEQKAFDHHAWVNDVHLSSATERSELKKRSQFPLTTDIFEGIKHTYNVAGGFLGYSGHFDDSVIEKVRMHPDVSKQLIPELSTKSKSRVLGSVLCFCVEIESLISPNFPTCLVPPRLRKRKFCT